MSKEEEDKIVDNLLNAINNILDINESWYDFIFVITKGQEVEDFNMPNGFGMLGDGKSKIFVDGQLWDDYENATDKNKKRRKYAKMVGIIAHELMHIRQFKYSSDKYMKDFHYELKLPNNTDKWTVSQRKKYDNLAVELEAFAFGKLVESTISQSKRISPLPTFTNRYQFKKIYLQMKDKYEKKIIEAFANCSKVTQSCSFNV